MTIQTQIAQKTLGADVRTLRKARGLTLSQMAESMGKSVGWLSQVERDLSTPQQKISQNSPKHWMCLRRFLG